MLEETAKEWAITIARKKGQTEEEEKSKIHAKVTEFGSYSLEVHFPQTDIDAICVFRSKYITRQEFHDGFVKLLENSEDFNSVILIN